MQPETTPNWVRDYVVANFPVTFNPVEQHDFDGLNEEWPGGPNQVCFVNCAFADAQLWVEKAVKELKKEKPTASVLFVPLVFNATYFREVVYPNAAEIHIFTWYVYFFQVIYLTSPKSNQTTRKVQASGSPGNFIL